MFLFLLIDLLQFLIYILLNLIRTESVQI